MSAEVKIVRVDATTGVEKAPTVGSWQGPWRVGVRYTLEDGRTVESGQRCRLRRDAVAFLSNECGRAPRHPMSALFDDDGRFYGTCEHVRIGGAW